MTPSRGQTITSFFNNATVATVIGIVIGAVGSQFLAIVGTMLRPAKVRASCSKSNEFQLLDTSNKVSIYPITIKNFGWGDTSAPIALITEYESKDKSSKANGTSWVYHQVISQDLFDQSAMAEKVKTEKIMIDSESTKVKGERVTFKIGEISAREEHRFTYVAINQKEITFQYSVQKEDGRIVQKPQACSQE